MDNIQQVMDAARNLWGRWMTSQRALVLSAAVLSLVTVVGVGIWSTRPEFVILASRLAPDQANDVVSQLEAAGIEFDLSYSGSTISVARTEMNRARLAVRETLGDQAAVPEFEDSIWADPSLQHVRLQRQQELRLAQSVMRFTAVREAVVHISQPHPSPFVRDQSPVTASVIVDLASDANFTGGDAKSIVSLISHGVEGLKPADVTLMDTRGRLLATEAGLGGDVSGQLEYVRTLETHLASKAEALLSQMLGPNRSMVRVTADVDFRQSERMETTYDPTNKVKLSETIKSESHKGVPGGTSSRSSGSSSGGPPGTSANIKPATGNGGSGDITIEENTTEFANTEIRDTVKETPGSIKRLTIAAVVDLSAATEGGTPPTVTTADLEALIKQAVGFDEQRYDEINVVNSTLAGMPVFSAPVVPVWEQYGPLLKNLSLGLAAVLMFVMGLLVLRRLQPVVMSANDAESGEDSIRQIVELSLRARQNPDLVAKVLETWTDEESNTNSQSTNHPSVDRRAA